MTTIVIPIDDERPHELSRCICKECGKKLLSVAVEYALWPRECPDCRKNTVFPEPPGYSEALPEKSCIFCEFCVMRLEEAYCNRFGHEYPIEIYGRCHLWTPEIRPKK